MHLFFLVQHTLGGECQAHVLHGEAGLQVSPVPTLFLHQGSLRSPRPPPGQTQPWPRHLEAPAPMVSFQLLSLAAPSALAVGTSGVASTATELEQPGARVPQLGNHFKQILDEPTILNSSGCRIRI